MRHHTAIAAGLGLLLFCAGCGSATTAASSSATAAGSTSAASSAPMSSAMSSAAMPSGTMSSGALSSGALSSEPMSSGAMSSEPMSSDAMSSEPMSSEPMSSEPMSSEPMSSEPMSSEPMSSEAMSSEAMSSGVMSSGASAPETVGDATGNLDAASVAWFTAVCTGLAPLKAEAAKMSTAGAGGTDAEKLTAVSPVLAAIGQLYSTTAGAASALPPPGFAGGSDYATRSVAAFEELGDLFRAGATSAANGDNSKVASLTSDASKGPAAVAMSALTLTTATKTAITTKIPSCTDIIT